MVMLPCFPLKQRGSWRFRDDLCPKKRPNANRLVVGPSPHVRDPRTLDWNGTFLKLPETEVNLIFFGSRLPRQRHDWNEGYAVSRITKRSNRFARTRVGT